MSVITDSSYLSNKIAAGFESGIYNGMILIDLQKAFATVNHNILLKKIELVRFSEETKKWFSSYLSVREFKVHIKNTFSWPGNLPCGVPQGSILRPLLFLLYKNNMLQAVVCELLLHADDTCLIFQHKDITKFKRH